MKRCVLLFPVVVFFIMTVAIFGFGFYFKELAEAHGGKAELGFIPIGFVPLLSFVMHTIIAVKYWKK